MTTLTYPLTMTVSEIAELPGAFDAFSFNGDDVPLTERIAQYMGNGMTPLMEAYMKLHGFHYDENGFTAQSRESVLRADHFFEIISLDYDSPNPAIDGDLHERLGYVSPSWYLFDLSGDDDVDYMSSQPRCLTSLLLSL